MKTEKQNKDRSRVLNVENETTTLMKERKAAKVKGDSGKCALIEYSLMDMLITGLI